MALPTPTPEVRAPNIEEVVLIKGQRADNMTDDQIFSLIAKLETEINNLESISNKPNKLKSKIEALRQDIYKLVVFVDGR